MTIRKRHLSFLLVLFLFCLTLCLANCGSSSSGPGAAVSGTVAAPGGTMAFARPAGPWRMFARLVESNVAYIRANWGTRPAGRIVADLASSNTLSFNSWWHTVSLPRFVAGVLVPDVHAADTSPGVSPVGGVAVQLVQLNNSGNVVQVLATAVTDSSGIYSLTTPAGFNPGSGVNYVVQAVGTSTLQAFVTGTSVNVDPYTHATVSLVTGSVTSQNVPLTNLAWAAINAVQDTVVSHSADINATSASAMVSGLTGAVNNDLESKNIVSSIAASGTITGTVSDTTGAGVANIQILVKTFGNQLTMAMTRTDASGNYTVHVPAGDYYVGAMNDTNTSYAASQWWASGGLVINMFAAGKVTVGSTPVTVNFPLPAGGRVSGTVTGGSSQTALAGVQVALTNAANAVTLQFIKTKPDGTYNFNVPPGTYLLDFRNFTGDPSNPGAASQQYGSAWYDGTASGSISQSGALKITVTAGATVSASMNLPAGYALYGSVCSDSTNCTGTPVAGINVRGRYVRTSPYNDAYGDFSFGTSTRADGSFIYWVQPGSYNVMTRGQNATLNASSSNQSKTFNANVFTITGKLQDSGGNGVPQVNVTVLGNKNASPNYFQNIGYEFSGGDGSFTSYVDPNATWGGNTVFGGTPKVVLYFAITDGRSGPGSTAYTAAVINSSSNFDYPTHGIQIPTSGSLSAGGSASLGTITLPDGVVLTGTVAASDTAVANRVVSVRSGTNGGTAYQVVAQRTNSSGSYSINLPANTTITCVVASTIGASTNTATIQTCTPNSNQQAAAGNTHESLPGTPGIAFAGGLQMTTSRTVNFDFNNP